MGEDAPAITTNLADDADTTASATNLPEVPLTETPQLPQTDAANHSLSQSLPLEERLKQLLEPEESMESITAAKEFFGRCQA